MSLGAKLRWHQQHEHMRGWKVQQCRDGWNMHGMRVAELVQRCRGLWLQRVRRGELHRLSIWIFVHKGDATGLQSMPGGFHVR